VTWCSTHNKSLELIRTWRKKWSHTQTHIQIYMHYQHKHTPHTDKQAAYTHIHTYTVPTTKESMYGFVRAIVSCLCVFVFVWVMYIFIYIYIYIYIYLYIYIPLLTWNQFMNLYEWLCRVCVSLQKSRDAAHPKPKKSPTSLTKEPCIPNKRAVWCYPKEPFQTKPQQIQIAARKSWDAALPKRKRAICS